LEQLHAQLRSEVASYDRDRFFAPDIARAAQGIREGRYRRALSPHLNILE
jgi:histidine ammonia-lyase